MIKLKSVSISDTIKLNKKPKKSTRILKREHSSINIKKNRPTNYLFRISKDVVATILWKLSKYLAKNLTFN